VGYLHQLAQQGSWLKLYRETTDYTRRVGQPTSQWLWSFLLHYGYEPREPKQINRVRRGIARRMRRGKPSPSWSSPLTTDFCQRIQFLDRRKELRKGRSGPPRTEREDHYRLLTGAMMQDTLELLNHTAAAFGIELRFPFWDRRLIEFCLSLPPEQKIRRGWTRYILRKAMEGILPPEIQWRGGKSNLAPGLEHGLLTYDLDRLEKIFSQDVPRLKDYVDLDVVSQAYQRFRSENKNVDDISTVCNAASLAVWLHDTSLRP